MAGLSEDLRVALCPKPCQGPVTTTQKRLMPDGTLEVSGEPPPPLCDACPERDNPKAPIRHIEVLHGFPRDGTSGRSWTPRAPPEKAEAGLDSGWSTTTR
jgi:hypothetical protein